MTDRQQYQLDTPASEWPWPFGLSDISYGLRRYFDDTSISVTSIKPISLPDRRPSIGRIRAIRVKYKREDQEHTCDLVVKEPQGTTRTGLAGAGKREVGLYESLAAHLPLETPHMLVGSALGDWLILELIEQSIDPEAWKMADYRKAVDQLTALHDRFWGLDIDLSTFPWLGHPLTTDFEIYVTAAHQGLERIRESGKPAAIAEQLERMELLERLIASANEIVAPLQGETHTLLHGDYWPGNITALGRGRQVVYDWQLAGVGPGVMDLLAFVYKSLWWFDNIPVDIQDIVEQYRQNIAESTGASWDQVEWSRLWDHALMWRFVQEWIDLLAVTPEPLMETWAARLERVWLGPVRAAAERRLAG
jgi:hypothetical protein